MQLSEAELLFRARQSEEQALGEIYDTYCSRLYGYAYRLSGDEHLARDLAADTFYRFLLALRAGSGPRDHLAAYLYRTTYHLFIDHYRRHPRADLSLEESLIAGISNMDETVDAGENQAQARLALMQLTPEQRQVIILKYFEGLSNEEVAVAIEKPVGAVKSLQARALASLRRILNKDNEGILP